MGEDIMLIFLITLISITTINEFLKYFNYKIEVDNEYFTYINIWKQKTTFKFSDVTTFKYKHQYSKYKSNKYSITLYIEKQKIAKVVSTYACYHFFLNDLEKYKIPKTDSSD